MMRRTTIILGLMAVAMAGCATTSTVDTPSGKAEVTIEGVSPDTVKPLIVNQMLDRKFTISHDSPYLIGFDRPTDSVLISLLAGSTYDATPNMRISYALAQTGTETRVIADLAVIGNPGSAFEHRHDINGGRDTPGVQAMLDTIKTQLETRSSPIPPAPTAQVE